MITLVHSRTASPSPPPHTHTHHVQRLGRELGQASSQEGIQPLARERDAGCRGVNTQSEGRERDKHSSTSGATTESEGGGGGGWGVGWGRGKHTASTQWDSNTCHERGGHAGHPSSTCGAPQSNAACRQWKTGSLCGWWHLGAYLVSCPSLFWLGVKKE